MIRMRIVPVRLSLINVSLSNLKNDDKKNKIDGINVIKMLAKASSLILFGKNDMNIIMASNKIYALYAISKWIKGYDEVMRLVPIQINSTNVA